MRPLLRYHGGKWMLADWIISNLPAHRIYVEPFGGAGSVLLKKSRSYSEVYNDVWDEIVNLFLVMRDSKKACELTEKLRKTPFARKEFDLAYRSKVKKMGDVEAARRMIVRSFCGFGSGASDPNYNTGFRSNSNRSGTTPAHDWVNYPDAIGFFTRRLTGVVIENLDAITLIDRHDTPDTLFYVDPPYPHSTRGTRQTYAHEMTDQDHRELADRLQKVRGKVVISGYACDLYDRELYRKWKRITRRALADGARERVEVLWFNTKAARSQTSLF